jgi:hypothetical protein
MAMELLQTKPDTLVLNVMGVLSHEEFTQAQMAATKVLEAEGPKRILINTAAFTGFAGDGDWGDLTFQVSDRLIVKMAIVGDPKMKDLILMFTGKGLRQFPIEFFASRDVMNARAWLEQNEPPSGI